MKDIIGHQKIIDFFDSAIAENKLSHAYCLSGPQDVGRMSIIQEVSTRILSSSRGNLPSHPDYKLIARKEKEEENTKKQSISVTQIREARRYVSKQPYKSEQKVLVIQEGEKMTKSAANAFLKTLEEPAEFTTIFLSVLDESLLPGTIASRCQNIYVRPTNPEVIKDYLLEKNYDEEITHDIALVSMGLERKAQDWVQENNGLENFQQECGRLNKIIKQPFYEKLSQVRNIHKKTGQSGREELFEIFSSWEILLQLVLMNLTEDKKLKTIELGKLKQLSLSKIKDILLDIHQAKMNLQQNINQKIVLEQVLLTIP